MSFAPLHNHSHYSLLDGLTKIDDMVDKAKEFGMPAIGLTDHGSMYGAIDFYMACKKAEIKPIIGVEGYMAARSRFQKEAGADSKRYHITLLSKDLTGYKNLMKMVTKANLEGYYYKPRMDRELLAEHHEGVICLSGCMGGELARAIVNKDLERAEQVIKDHIDIFGRENYFIEIMNHPKIENATEIMRETIRLARKFDLPLVGTHDSHYLCADDSPAHDTLVAINTHADPNDQKRFFDKKGEDFSFISPDQARELFAETPEAVTNTLKVAEMCNLELTIGKFIFPDFPIPETETADSLLKKLCLEGLKNRGLSESKEAIERLEYELGIIAFKGYAHYFLVVEDLIRFARENGIYYNIRGSVAGSMTTYVLDITKIDPLAYNIPFERFLNPDRPSAPDIDMDFADNRRDEVIEYAKKKYGDDKVAQIGTFGTMLAKGAVRDVARALGYPYAVGDKISNLIPMGSQGFAMTIERALGMEPELKQLYEEDRATKEVIDMAKKIEGCARHISVHAAGVVISPEPLTEYTPLQYDPKGKAIITQYDMYAVGEDGVGLTKFDFLGLRNLAILTSAIDLIKSVYAHNINIDTIPIDDKKTFEMLARGETEGLFQLNGAGMTKWLKELKPSTIHDINAMVALYRPGPMQFIPDYIARKHNPKLIKYLDPALEPILKTSYGVLVYQDDLLMMANNLAGYSWGEVDKFRKAVGKKIPALMAEQKEKFIKGCIEHSGWSKEKAKEIWAWLEPFAAYGFNKAHSASYGLVAYQTAHLKANFPVAYMCACLNAESGDIDQVSIYVAECKRMGIPILPPDINESVGDFTIIRGETDPSHQGIAEVDRIRFGLFTIKNLGAEIAQAIVDERVAGGHFKNFTEFLERVKHKNLNRKSLEALIQTGAMDNLGHERGKLIANLDDALTYSREFKNGGSSQTSIFGIMEDKSTIPTLRLKDAEPALMDQKLAWEKELLGLYISGHPLDWCKDKFAEEKNTLAFQKTKEDGSAVIAAGLIEEVKRIQTKKGDFMAFVRISDYSDSMEVVVFSKPFEQFKSILIPGTCIALKGKLSIRNNEPSILVESMKKLAPEGQPEPQPAGII